MWEAFSARTDHQLIRTYIDQPGHTIPIELSVWLRSTCTNRRIATEA